MNFSTMCKRAAALLLALFLFTAWPVPGRAAEAPLPDAQVLIVYSDEASEGMVEDAYRVAELLTYEGISAVFAPASRCRGELSRYGHIVFCRVETYPRSILQEMSDLEKAPQTAGGAGRPAFLFLGNPFLKDYLDSTGRGERYTAFGEATGVLAYEFPGLESSRALTRLDELIFLKGERDYEAGTLAAGQETGYFCCRQGTITHICADGLDEPLVLSAFSGELARWASDGAERSFRARYLVLDKIYPFQDPEQLYETVKALAERGTPYTISVMPVYTHGDYPAMQRFCEVLRYAQSRGAAIVLHAPLDQMTDLSVDALNQAVSQAVSAYVQQGVYPLGLQVPENWLMNSDTAEVMSRFRTILVSTDRDERIAADWEEKGGNRILGGEHDWIAPAAALDELDDGYAIAASTATYLDIRQSQFGFSRRVEACEQSAIPLQSLWDSAHSFYTNSDTMTYGRGELTVNGRRVSTVFVPTEYDEAFSYGRNQLQRFSWDLTEGSRKLITAVSAVSVVFLVFLFLARQSNRRRFLYEKEDKEEYWANKR